MSMYYLVTNYVLMQYASWSSSWT